VGYPSRRSVELFPRKTMLALALDHPMIYLSRLKRYGQPFASPEVQ
jgi:hypothetical protein